MFSFSRNNQRHLITVYLFQYRFENFLLFKFDDQFLVLTIHIYCLGSSNRLPKNTIAFDIRDIGFDEEISRAELNLFKLRPKLPKNPAFRRFVPVEVLDANNGDTAALRLLSTYGGGWKSFDLTQTVKKWHRRRNELNGIVIRVEGKQTGNRSISFGSHESMERKPFLIVHTQSNKRYMGLSSAKEAREIMAEKPVMPMPKQERRSRNARGSNGHPCKRKSMIVDTTKIGWDSHVLAPRTFDAYRCEGKCKSYTSQAVKKQTNHAVLQAILSQLGTRYNGRPVKPPCCAPSQFENKTLLLHRNIKGQSVIGVEEFTDMVVKSCACL